MLVTLSSEVISFLYVDGKIFIHCWVYSDAFYLLDWADGRSIPNITNFQLFSNEKLFLHQNDREQERRCTMNKILSINTLWF